MAARRPAIKIRRAELRDAEAIQATMAAPRAMAGTLQLPFPTAEMWRKRIADIAADDYLLVAEVAGKVVGNLGLHAAGRARRRHAGALGMSVRDDWQRRGVGTALMAVAINIADNWLNYRRLELTVYTDNVAALALYRKFGFAIEGTHKDYAFRDGRYIDAFTMARVRSAIPASTTPSTTKNTKRGPDVHRKATKTARKRKSS
jgi:putative acetyltransferase